VERLLQLLARLADLLGLEPLIERVDRDQCPLSLEGAPVGRLSRMLPRMKELETDLQARRGRASAEGWLGEIEGIDRTLRLPREKQATAERLSAHSAPSGVVDLGMPGIAAGARR
jgi:hypothetical protein